MDGVFLFSCFQWVIALEGTILINSTTISSLLLQKDWIVVCLHDLLKSLLVLVEKRQWSGKPLWGKNVGILVCLENLLMCQFGSFCFLPDYLKFIKSEYLVLKWQVNLYLKWVLLWKNWPNVVCFTHTNYLEVDQLITWIYLITNLISYFFFSLFFYPPFPLYVWGAYC